jgi:glutaredoxin-related protein
MHRAAERFSLTCLFLVLLTLGSSFAFAGPGSTKSHTYSGYVRIYLTQIVSDRYYDYSEYPYDYAFLDFIVNEPFTLEYGDTIHESVTYYGVQVGLHDSDEENTEVMGAVFGAGNGSAHYVDASVAVGTGETDIDSGDTPWSHSVFIEEGTAHSCPACPLTRYALKHLHDTCSYDFNYVAMVTDNSIADQYLDSVYNLTSLPTNYVDGGFIVSVGGTSSEEYYFGLIDQARHRPTPDICLEITFTWLASAQLQIDYVLYNRELTNEPPAVPVLPSGNSRFLVNEQQTFTTGSRDPDGDSVYYRWSFGDGDSSEWLGPYSSGQESEVAHTWIDTGTFDVAVLARDKFDAESGWSDVLQVLSCDFTCGDADGNDIVNISDAVYLIAYIFGGGPVPDPLLSGDPDCNWIVNISDAVYLIAYIFGSGDAPCAGC